MKEELIKHLNRVCRVWSYEDWLNEDVYTPKDLFETWECNEKYLNRFSREDAFKIIDSLQQQEDEKVNVRFTRNKNAFLNTYESSIDTERIFNYEMEVCEYILCKSETKPNPFVYEPNSVIGKMASKHIDDMRSVYRGLLAGEERPYFIREWYDLMIEARAREPFYQFLKTLRFPNEHSDDGYLEYEEAAIYIKLTRKKIHDPRSDKSKNANELAKNLCNKTVKNNGTQLYNKYRKLEDGIDRYVNTILTEGSKRSIKYLQKRFKNILKLYPETEELVRPHLDEIEERLSSM
jgi:hypothetical protein